MKLCGMSQQAIADKLNSDGILTPLQYKKSIGVGFNSSFAKSMKPKWGYNAVTRILKNEVYTGRLSRGNARLHILMAIHYVERLILKMLKKMGLKCNLPRHE